LPADLYTIPGGSHGTGRPSTVDEVGEGWNEAFGWLVILGLVVLVAKLVSRRSEAKPADSEAKPAVTGPQWEGRVKAARHLLDVEPGVPLGGTDQKQGGADVKRMRKPMILGSAVFIIVLLLFVVYRHTIGAKVIGTASGPEYEYITIDNKTYVINFANNYSNADKGDFLGVVRGDDVTFRIYSVDGDEDHKYIYRLSGFDGAFYRLKG
jgi:hypothetical protein